MKEKYLQMQKNYYDADAARWSLENKNPVVGSYHKHNQWADYDTHLFKNFDTTGLVALEYGCGPGRNIIRFSPRFKRIDGVDISAECINKAKQNLQDHGTPFPYLEVNQGNDIPFGNDSYDVVFSVICLQHICCHSIRIDIFREVHRVLKPGGRFCFQMGFGPHPTFVDYYTNYYDARTTNGGRDTRVDKPEQLQQDLEALGFRNFQADIRPVGPGDSHANWIWVQVEK